MVKKGVTIKELKVIDSELCKLIKLAVLFRYLGEDEYQNDDVTNSPLVSFYKRGYEMENCLFLHCSKENKQKVYDILKKSNLFEQILENKEFDGGFQVAIIKYKI